MSIERKSWPWDVFLLGAVAGFVVSELAPRSCPACGRGMRRITSTDDLPLSASESQRAYVADLLKEGRDLVLVQLGRSLEVGFMAGAQRVSLFELPTSSSTPGGVP